MNIQVEAKWQIPADHPQPFQDEARQRLAWAIGGIPAYWNALCHGVETPLASVRAGAYLDAAKGPDDLRFGPEHYGIYDRMLPAWQNGEFVKGPLLYIVVWCQVNGEETSHIFRDPNTGQFDHWM